MLSDGSNAFTWDARGQVSSVNAASPLYDAFGRRTKNLAGTQMLFDGANSVQEMVGSTVTANRLTGGVDEFFSRADSTGTYYPLSDNLGSTVALTDSTPNVVTAYTYDPYGATSVSGSNSNFFDYTGRENDGNGLYYYRARYYEPTLGRFVSEDPAGFLGGINGYAYTQDDPTDFLDPLGLDKDKFGGCRYVDPFFAAWNLKLVFGLEIEAGPLSAGGGYYTTIAGPDKGETGADLGVSAVRGLLGLQVEKKTPTGGYFGGGVTTPQLNVAGEHINLRNLDTEFNHDFSVGAVVFVGLEANFSWKAFKEAAQHNEYCNVGPED